MNYYRCKGDLRGWEDVLIKAESKELAREEFLLFCLKNLSLESFEADYLKEVSELAVNE